MLYDGDREEKCEMGFIQDHLEEAARQIVQALDRLGVDTDTEDFRNTPRRVARAFLELCSGSRHTTEKVAEIMATSFPSRDYDEMVVAGPFRVVSLCPHHLLPVHCDVWIGYVPNQEGRVLGLSKLVRLATVLAARPVLQEQLAVDIAKAMEAGVKPMGVGVLVSGEHDCMRSRGVRQTVPVRTSKLLGCMLEQPSTRSEFLRLCGF